MTNNTTSVFECTVCYSTHCVALRAPCHHEFCAECVARIMATCPKKACPLCRNPFPTHVDQYTVTVYPGAFADACPPQINQVFPRVCRAGNMDDVTRILPHVTNMNTPGALGYTALYCSARTGHAPLVDLLLQHGAAVNQADRYGMTPLFISALCGHTAVVRVLLRHGADIHWADHTGMTPLEISAYFGHKPVVKLLLQHGENVADIKSTSRCTKIVDICSNHETRSSLRDSTYCYKKKKN